ncbi:MAG: YceI family protein [Bacteroidales bacterium]|nr:YceI family protein [Bacteroidales bacterium]
MRAINSSFTVKLSVLSVVTSNIKAFSCNYQFNQYQKQSQFPVNPFDGEHHIDSLVISIPATAFDCGNKLLKRDFRKTLNAGEHPDITLKTGKIWLGNDYKTKRIHAEVMMTIGGKRRSENISYTIEWIDNRTLVMRGKTSVDITDFDLDPTSRLFGLVKVDEVVTIDFFFKFARQ